MAVLTWDEVGERLYETGTKRGVIYPMSADGKYPKGAAWNGLTKVDESPSGGEPTALWANDSKYNELMSSEQFGFTIEAYTYPDEFAECDGSAELVKGVTVKQQKRKKFGFSYTNVIGNDVDGEEHGEKIHLVYGCLAKPTSKSRETINDSPNAITMSWECSTTPVSVGGLKPTAHLEIDTTKVDVAKVKLIKDAIYGTTSKEPYLPLPDEIKKIITGAA